MVFGACTADAVNGSQDEKVFNAEDETEDPTDVPGDAEAAVASSTCDELGGGAVDEGVVNDSETFCDGPADAEGVEYKVSPDP